MNEEERLFDGFALLEPSAEDSAAAISKARAALLAVEPTEPAIMTSANRRWTRLAFAALALVVAGVAWLNLSRNDRLLAQVVRQLASADSVRVILQSKRPDSDWEMERVTTFAREFGFSEQHFLDGELVQKDIDNGVFHWSMRSQHKFVTQSESVEFAHHLDDLLNPLKGQYEFDRFAKGDQIIAGVSCECYQSVIGRRRISIWLDGKRRAQRAFIEEDSEGQWQPSGRINVAYDVEIDESSFQRPSGDGVKIVETSQLVDEVFSLEDAIHRESKLGYELAVHDAKRISDVEYCFLVSFRPTKETLAKLTLIRGESPGDLHPSARYQQIELGMQESETVLPIAVARCNGVRFYALWGVFRGVENERVERARPGFVLFAHGKLWDEVKPISDVLLEFELPEEETPIEDVVRSVYDKIAMLEPVTMEQLYLVDDQDGREFVDRQFVVGGYRETIRQGPRPSEISFADFLDHMRSARFRPKRSDGVEKSE